VCVCVRERERERERGHGFVLKGPDFTVLDRQTDIQTHILSHHTTEETIQR
jgi:hypothetical protein